MWHGGECLTTGQHVCLFVRGKGGDSTQTERGTGHPEDFRSHTDDMTLRCLDVMSSTLRPSHAMTVGNPPLRKRCPHIPKFAYLDT